LENDLFSASLRNCLLSNLNKRWVAGVWIQPYPARCSQARGARMRGKIHLRTAPLVMGVVWDSGQSSSIGAYHGLLPTKTSQLVIQLCGNGPSFVSNGFHVFTTRFVNLFSCLIFVAIILLLVSLMLMAFLHLVLISLSVCCLSRITLSQRRTHIRWAASDIRIMASLDAPFLSHCLRLFSISCLLLSLLFIHPHPRMSPKVILGHSRCSLSQLCSIRV